MKMKQVEAETEVRERENSLEEVGTGKEYLTGQESLAGRSISIYDTWI